jgi:hypothetical protein
MNLALFEKMPADQLREYIAFLLWHYRVVDAFWFLNVAERFDQKTAESINTAVWAKVSGMAAKDLVHRFGINDRGLEGFIRALRFFPWCILVDYQIDQGDDAVILTVPSCPTQVARLKHGLEEYDCKEMHRQEFLNFGRIIEPRLSVECLFAPPDEHPAEMHCKWRFTLSGQPEDDILTSAYWGIRKNRLIA